MGLRKIKQATEKIKYTRGKLKVTVEYENEPSLQALKNFNKMYNKHFHEFNK